jgi:hypothetical protein
LDLTPGSYYLVIMGSATLAQWWGQSPNTIVEAPSVSAPYFGSAIGGNVASYGPASTFTGSYALSSFGLSILVATSTVPEPSTLVFVSAGLLVLIAAVSQRSRCRCVEIDSSDIDCPKIFSKL